MSKLARFTAYLNKFLLNREEWEQLQQAIKDEIQHETILEADNEKLRAALLAIQQGDTGEYTPAQVAGIVLGGRRPMTDNEIYEDYQAVVQLAGKADYPGRYQVFANLTLNHNDTWIAQHMPEIVETLAKIEEAATGRDCSGDWRNHAG